jgi:Rad3-related DNA helicase
LSIVARALLPELELEKAIYSTPSRKLVNQLKNDKHLRIPALVGKANYPCLALEKQGFTADTCPLPKKMRALECPNCPYEKARAEFQRAKLGVLTFDKLLYDKAIDDPDILIIDESHGLENQLQHQAELKLPNDIDEKNIQDGLASWYRETLDALDKAERELESSAEGGLEADQEAMTEMLKLSRQLKTIEYRERRIAYVIGIVEEGQKFIIDADRQFKTLDSRRQFARLCKIPSLTILSSGTPCPQILTRDYTTVTMPNPIPEENAPIYYLPIGKMSSACREATIDLMAPVIGDLHMKYGNLNTIVHCHSYKIAEVLGNAINDYYESLMPRRKKSNLDYRNKIQWMTPRTKELDIKKWMSDTGHILMSVDCWEGLDLAGPNYPLGILACVPFGYRADPWLLAREKADEGLPINQQWSVMQTALKLMQAPGRTTRGPTDKSDTYILDKNLEWFIKRYRSAFREDFLRRIRVKRG